MKTDKFQNKYRIPSARAVWHDYNGGAYFITICTKNHKHYFGEIQNGCMINNELGNKLDEIIVDIKNHNSYCEIPVFQIMPNHVHLIVFVDGNCRDVACRVSTGGTGETGKNEKMREIAEKCGLLSTAMGGLKSALTKYANKNKIIFDWQTRFHDHIIRNQDELNRIVNYIENNPSTWKDDEFFSA